MATRETKEQKQDRRRFRKGEKHLIIDIMALEKRAFSSFCSKYSNLSNEELRVLMCSYVVWNDNKGTITKQDLERYTTYKYCTIHKITSNLVKKGYMEKISRVSTRSARRFALTIRTHNALRYYNRCVISLLDARMDYVTKESVLYSDARVQAHYKQTKATRLKQYLEQKD